MFTPIFVTNDDDSKALKIEKLPLHQIEKDINELLERLPNNQRDFMTGPYD